MSWTELWVSKSLNKYKTLDKYGSHIHYIVEFYKLCVIRIFYVLCPSYDGNLSYVRFMSYLSVIWRQRLVSEGHQKVCICCAIWNYEQRFITSACIIILPVQILYTCNLEFAESIIFNSIRRKSYMYKEI